MRTFIIIRCCSVDESNVMDTTTEFEPDVQFDDHNATDSDMMPARESDGNDDIAIPVDRPYIMMMFDTDKDNEEEVEDISTGREEEIIDDLILCDAPTYYVPTSLQDYISDNNDSTKMNLPDFDVCCMNGMHNKIFFMQQHNDKNGGIRGIVKRADRKIGLAQQMMMMKLVG